MVERRTLLAAAVGSVLAPGAAAQQASPAAARMGELGPENGALRLREGLWDVTETAWAAPGADPVSTTGLVAERRMVGPILQEVLRSASDGAAGAALRIDYLTFNRVEGRWDYVSMDVRAPVGIMPAWSFNRGEGDSIVLSFQPFAVAGGGTEVGGQMLRMDAVLTRQGADRDVKDQHFILADGTGTAWLAHRYAYVRRS